MISEKNYIWVINIDAHTKEVGYVQVDRSYENMKKILKTDTIQAQKLNQKFPVYMLMDENARLWCEGEKLFFRLSHWTLVNRVILVGIADDGEWADVPLELSDIISEVEFLPIDYVDAPPEPEFIKW